MPGDEYFGKPLLDAVANGSVPQSRLDDMVHRLLRSMFAAGVIDHPPTPRFVVDPFKGRDDSQHIAEESIVLLRNQNNLLPLHASTIHSIAVIGAHADVGILSGGGSAQVDAPGGNAISPTTSTAWNKPVYFPSSPLRYIREHAPQADVRFDPGTDPAAAAKLARSAEVAIVFADQYMSEGSDSLTLALPNHQNELIRAVAEANPKTVVVLVTGNPVSMPWVDSVGGILEAWYPGIAGGQAIANLLFGTTNPSGKLPITFPRTEADLPHPQIFGIDTSRGDAGLPENWNATQKETSFPADYSEGVRFGYKWFQSTHKQPLFPFGFGLSYTSYRYSDLHIDGKSKAATFTVKNVGERPGTEIAQLYVQLPSAAHEDFRRLAAWQRITLKPGEQRTVSIAMEPLALATFREDENAWSWLPGEYVVSVGGSSEELALKVTTKLN
jgi:beta-glucosidase